MALDIQQDMLAKLKQKLLKPENSDIRNVEIINRSAYDLPLEPGSIDLVFMVTVLQEVPDKPRVLQEIKRVLRPGGTLAVSEFIIDPDYPWRSTTERMVQKAGFAVDGHSGNLWSYTVRFRKP
jgi:ubiquinone/menaquinone biosynthesis C-methylase UbiE